MHLKISILLAAALLAGFAVGCKSTTPGKLSAVQPISDGPRAGNAYLLRGFIGIFSEGIDNLTSKINESGVRAHVYQDDQWALLADTIRDKYRAEKDHEPIILIGHSYGADDVIRIARKLNDADIEVALLVTLDPVTPPKIPGNVKYCINLYQSNGAFDALPWLRGIAVQADEPAPAKLVNANIRKDRPDLLEAGTDHFNIEKKEKIHAEVVKQVLAICPPREVWVAQVAIRNAVTASPAIPLPALPVPPIVNQTVTVRDGGGDARQPD